MRVDAPKGTEMRGREKIYDPWLRIPIDEAGAIAKKMAGKYPKLLDELLHDINASGASHINRVFFDKIWGKLDNQDHFAKIIIKKCTPNVNVFFLQFYAHRLYEVKRYVECYDMLQRSIDLARTFADPSWDKWVVSGHFFNARYHSSEQEKTEYCNATLLGPRILTYSPHLKYWKIFRVAAWLVGHNITSPNAKAGIERYKSLNFDGYEEIRGGDRNTYSTIGVLDDPKKCLTLMTDDLAHHLGNP